MVRVASPRWRDLALLMAAAWLFREPIHRFLADHAKPQLLRLMGGGTALSLRQSAVPGSGTWDPIVSLRRLGARDFRMTEELERDEGNYQSVTESAWPMRASPASRFLVGVRGDEPRMRRQGCKPAWKAMDGEKEGKIVIAVCRR